MKKLTKMFCVLLSLCLVGAMLAACNTATQNPQNPQDSGAGGDTSAGGDSSGGAVPAGDVVELKMAYSQPNTSTPGQCYEFLAEAINEETGGTVKVTTFPAGSLYTETDMLDGLMSGQVDMGHLSAPYISPTMKEMAVLEVPGVYRTDRHMEFIYAYADVLDRIYEQYGLKSMLGVAGHTMTFTNTGSEFIKSPSDLAGLNVRASGKWVGETMKLWGGNPVTIALGDLSTAVERKTVNVIYGGDISVIQPFKIYEMADAITLTTLQEIYGAPAMNLETWNKLSAEQQEGIGRALDRYAVFGDELIQTMYDGFLADLEANGNPTYELTEEENQAFIDVGLSILDDPTFQESVGDLGKELIEVSAELRSHYDEPYVPGEIPERYKK